MAADRPITPEQAALAAKAAGLDLDRPLSEQLQSDQNGDLEQRVADLSERGETLSEALGAAGRPAEPHELLAERLHAAQRHAQAVQRWRDENPEKAASYNDARRVQHEPRPCAECGELFVPGRSDTLVARICVGGAGRGGRGTRRRGLRGPTLKVGLVIGNQ